jgi:hypothetical protein
MGRATYRGTVLSGRDNFDTWKKDLMNFLRAEDLEDFIDGLAEDPSIDKKGKTVAGIVQVEAVAKEKKAEIKEYRKNESICNVAVLNSLDEGMGRKPWPRCVPFLKMFQDFQNGTLIRQLITFRLRTNIGLSEVLN